MTTVHSHGSVSTRFPPSCPDGSPDFCFKCEGEVCHGCGGGGAIGIENVADGVRCQDCDGEGTLAAQLARAQDEPGLTDEDRRWC